ncbi:AcrR family transcriptional regulator [Nocardioides daedukensis]|uniref:AcrR family transcriptional regulator n=1 Tax=Nocardioides daedukensis TaxID=634462 RepID=A0A7Y9UTT5_9ACTN|nr:TetR family transcriptional regulator [Nocardioides daedukensis]NYG59114.1 AcrR family transcriptional regulator [Nocardioides daedukensis]
MNQEAEGAGGETFRNKVHGLLRASILDAAWARANESTWGQVRIADIARDVGVSRQTIYNEFGTKDQLSLAIFHRELERFLVELEAQIQAADRFSDAVRQGLTWMLDETAGHKMVGRMLADARNGSTDGLIPILTLRSDLIIVPVRTRLAAIIKGRWPEADDAATEVVADLYVRFVLGLVVTPTDLDTGAMVEALVGMAVGMDVAAARR